jgi:hypothetical protein
VLHKKTKKINGQQNANGSSHQEDVQAQSERVKHVICSKGGISWLAETPSRFESVALFGSHLVGDSQLKVGHIGDPAQVL